jgi:hypothetical protein
MNQAVYGTCPGVITVAEESTGVTQPALDEGERRPAWASASSGTWAS